jgi:hypothetical protein
MKQEVVMSKMPASVSQFLSGQHFAVAGVSRQPNQPANPDFSQTFDPK